MQFFFFFFFALFDIWQSITNFRSLSLMFLNKGNCFGCTNHGNVDMKHPNYVGYAGGHVMNTFMPINGPKIMTRCFEEEDVRMIKSLAF